MLATEFMTNCTWSAGGADYVTSAWTSSVIAPTGASRRVHGMLRARVERLTRREQRPQVGHRLRMIRHRPAVSLADDPVPVILGRGAAATRSRPAARASRRCPAMRRCRHRWRGPSAVSSRAPWPAFRVRAGGSVLRRTARRAPPVTCRRPFRSRRSSSTNLARSFRASRLPMVVLPAPRRPRSATTLGAWWPSTSRQQIGGGDAECVRQIGQPFDRDVAAAGLELHEESRRDARSLGQLAQRPAACAARVLDLRAEHSKHIRRHR